MTIRNWFYSKLNWALNNLLLTTEDDILTSTYIIIYKEFIPNNHSIEIFSYTNIHVSDEPIYVNDMALSHNDMTLSKKVVALCEGNQRSSKLLRYPRSQPSPRETYFLNLALEREKARSPLYKEFLKGCLSVIFIALMYVHCCINSKGTLECGGRFGMISPGIGPGVSISNVRPVSAVEEIPREVRPSYSLLISKMSPLASRASMGYRSNTQRLLLQKNTHNPVMHSSAYITTTISLRQRVVLSTKFIADQHSPHRVTSVLAISSSEFLITKKHILASTPQGVLHIEPVVNEFIHHLGRDKRLASLQKYLNFQEWVESDSAPPTLYFNADSTSGLYKYNKNMANVVKKHLKLFLAEHPNLCFRLDHRSSDSDHVQQKSQLDLYGMPQKDAMTYQIRKNVHSDKTSELLFIRPDHIDTIPEWFIHNGERTISFLEDMWKQGKLGDTVESFKQFEGAIQYCVEEDIARFEASGFKGTTCSELEQTSAISQAATDCERFGHDVSYKNENLIDKTKLKQHIKKLVRDAKSIAAFIYSQPGEGRNLSTVVRSSRAFEKTRFLNNLESLITRVEEICPELKTDASFINNKQDLPLIMQGKGSFKKEITLQRYAKLVKDLRNVRSHCSLYGRNPSFLISPPTNPTK